jgi:hypothetical protein
MVGPQLDGPAVSALGVRSVIGWVTKIYYLELLRASEGTLSCCSGCLQFSIHSSFKED